MTSLSALFSQHLARLQKRFDALLEKNSCSGLVIAAGSPMVNYADDSYAPFRPTPHFAYWCPAAGPHHVLVIRPGHKPRVMLFRENDFWHEAPRAPESFWADHFEVDYCTSIAQCWQDLSNWHDFAFIGPESELPQAHNLKVNPPLLLANADWARGAKTEYEVHCLREANRKAAKAHQAVRQAFAAGGVSELGLHQLYLAHLSCVDEELPYHTIIGLDANSSILHYQYKRTSTKGEVLLIDAGAKFQHYGSDITRTYASRKAPPTFRNLLQGVDKLQQLLCNSVKAGVAFGDLHLECHRLLADLLREQQIIQHCSIDEAIDKNLTYTFLPHGLGHMLGIQVHDVSGKQADADGTACVPSARFPQLRTLRELREYDVITIEPGLYFIPMLLDKMRHGAHAHHFNFPLIDELLPFGGIRIEDNVVVGKEGCENLTRQFLGSDCIV
jgi:Xaa-Pro dipeptidase